MGRTPPLTITAWLRWDAVQRVLPPAGGRLLDIGAGTGAIGSLLADRYDYVGVEPDPESHALAVMRIGARGVVHNARAEEFDPSGDFDLVCAFEVLEHIPDDRAALEQWARHARPGGSLVVSVPHGQDRYGEGDARAGHIRRYDAPELVARLRGAGLVEVTAGVYGSPWGNAQEAVRNLAFRLRPSGKSPPELTAESARFLHPPGWSGLATRAASIPLRHLQRPLSRRGVGTGLVASGRVPE